MKGGFDIASAKFSTIEIYPILCAGTLAHAHARSGDAVAISAYLGKYDQFTGAVEVFAVAEPPIVDRDHKRLLDAIVSKEIAAIDSDDLS